MGTLTPARDAAPISYSQLYEDWWDYVQALVVKFGIVDGDKEDVASEILLKFFEQGFLERFNEKAEFETPRGMKRTSFRGFLSGFVSLYVRQAKDRQATRARKEPVRLEQPIGDGATWIEVFGPSFHAEIDAADFHIQAARALAHLETLPIRGERDLPRIFRMLVKQVIDEGCSNRKAIADAFGVSDTAVCLWVAELRKQLTAIGFAPGMVL